MKLSIIEESPVIEYQENFNPLFEEPKASIVIVAYNTNHELVHCIDSLQYQSFKEFEILVIDNGKNEAVFDELHSYPIRYFRLKNNYLPSAARNVGISHSKGEVICFLDDDGLAHVDYVKEHITAIQSGALGVRGKILPKTDTLYNHLAMHYNLGDKVIPSYVEMENNCSFPRSVLNEVRGFNPDVFMFEGAELSYRIVKRFGGHDKLLYWPDALIFHDYSTTLKKLARKSVRITKMKVILDHLYPDFQEYIESYFPFPYAKIPWPEKKVESVKLLLLMRFQQMIYRWGPTWYRQTLSL